MIELLVVMAIMTLMITLLMPSLSGFSSTVGRRGAVNVLMNGFEQARAAALESGSTIYVVMRRNPNIGGQDAYVIFREHLDGDTIKYERLTKWQKLPKGVLFYEAVGSLVEKGATPDGEADMVALFPPGETVAASETFAIAFNRHGQVAFPQTGLDLYLAEAHRSDATKAQAKGASLTITEKLTFRKYTGRAQLDFEALPST